MCLNETYITVHIGKNLSDKFPIQNGLKHSAALSPLLFNFVLEYTIRRLQENQEGLKSNGAHQHLASADDGENIDTIKKSKEAPLHSSKEVGPAVNSEKTKYILIMLVSHGQKIGQKHSTNIANRFSEDVGKFKYLGTTLTDQNCIYKEIKSRLNSLNACYHSVQSLLSSSHLPSNVKVKINKTIILPVVLYGCETWSLNIQARA
jgi:hypothetical protein